MDSSFDALMSAYKGAQDTDGMMCYACDAAPKKPQTLQQHLQRYHKGQMPKGDCSWLKQYKKDHPNWKAEAEKVTKAEEDVDTVKKDAKGSKDGVSKELLERCDKKMSDEEVYALREMASDKNTPADVLKKLAFAEHYTSANANCEIQEAVANNPNTPNDILKHLSGFPHSNEDYKGKSYRNDVAESAKATLAAKKKDRASKNDSETDEDKEDKGKDKDAISDHVKGIVEEKASSVFYDNGVGIAKEHKATIDGNVLTVEASDISDAQTDDFIKHHVKDLDDYCASEGVKLSDIQFTIEKYDTGKKYNSDYKDYWKKGDPIFAKKLHLSAKIEGGEADEKKAQREREEKEVEEILERQKDYKFNDPNVEISEKGFRVGDTYAFMLDGKPRKGKITTLKAKASAGWDGFGIVDDETGKKYVCSESHLADCNPFTIGITLAADGQYGKRERVCDVKTAMERLVSIANEKSDMDDCVRSLKELFFRTVHPHGTTIQSFGLTVDEPRNNSTASEAWQKAQNEKEQYLRKKNPRRMWRDVKWVVSSNREAKHIFSNHNGDYSDWDSEQRTYAGIFPKTFKTKAEAQEYLDKKGWSSSWSVDTCRVADTVGMAEEIAKRIGVKVGTHTMDGKEMKSVNFDSFTDTDGKTHDMRDYFDWTTEN